VDRLARSVRGLAEVLETLDAAGVGFRSATEPFDTTSPAGRMMVQMLGVFAEFERATIIDRVIAGMERKSSQGGWCGGTQPFGYRAVKGEGRLEVDEDEAPLIPVIFDLYANKRLGSHAIANQLSASGLTTRSGRPWQFKSILTVLRNRTYLGQVNFRGVWTDGDHPPLHRHQSHRTQRHLPLLHLRRTTALWDEVLCRRPAPGRGPRRRRRPLPTRRLRGHRPVRQGHLRSPAAG
jgi:site-specific DNA recombinase